MASIADIRGLTDPSRGYLWDMDIISAGNQVIETIKPGSSEFNLAGKSISLPTDTLGRTTETIGGQRVSYAGLNSPSNDGVWTTEIRCDADMNILKSIKRWQRIIRSPDLGTSTPKRLYEAVGVVRLKGPSAVGIERITHTIELVGLWPINIDTFVYDHEDGETPVVLSVNWSYDYEPVAPVFT